MKKLFLFLGTVAVLGACKKDNSSPSSSASRTDLLTAKTWQLSNIAITVGGTPVPSSLLVSACDMDDTYKFNADNSLTVDAGATKCNTTDPQTRTGTWAFNSDQSKLTLTIPNSSLNGEADVKELSASTLHLYAAQSSSGITYTIDTTFSPK